jgi:hypothetical protein
VKTKQLNFIKYLLQILTIQNALKICKTRKFVIKIGRAGNHLKKAREQYILCFPRKNFPSFKCCEEDPNAYLSVEGVLPELRKLYY